MPTNLKIPQNAFRLGCGRYVQESGALSTVAEEIERLGKKKPYILGGETAFSLTKKTLKESFDKAGMIPVYHTYKGFCCREKLAEIMETDEYRKCDIVIGVGGGNIMDAAKYCAVLSGKPIINIPTSSATCAAYTPLSVCYSEEGRTVGTTHHAIEVNCVIVDMDILCRQPVRLLLSGIYDSVAKIYELKQRLIGIKPEDMDIGLYSSYYLSGFVNDFLMNKLDECCRDVSEGKNTKTVYDMVYITIALTGVVSGLARGSNQTALGHKFYESLRALYPKEVYSFLHGEMVAIGLILQIAYNGDGDVDEFRNKMKSLGMLTRLSELNLKADDETVNTIYNKILQSSAMAGTNEEEHAKLKRSLEMVR